MVGGLNRGFYGPPLVSIEKHLVRPGCSGALFE